MSQIEGGIRGLLRFPRLYREVQRLASQGDRWGWVRQYVRPRPGDRVLDIGCGLGDIVEALPDGVVYTGFDLNRRYIDAARKRFGGRATFHCAPVTEVTCEPGTCDLVLALGVLHHLDREAAQALVTIAQRVLRPGGRLVTIDPAFVPGQSPIARLLIAMDRGRNVRTEQEYQALVRCLFPTVSLHVRHDLSRFPYTHAILECTKE